MNKQEAVEKIKELKGCSRGTLGEGWIDLGIDKALNIVKQLDEPEKPVLTKGEANWVENLITFYDLPDALYRITRCGYGYLFAFEINERKYELPLASDARYAEISELKERLMNAVLYGYVVEEEKLYTVELPNPNEPDSGHIVLQKDKNNKVFIDWHYADDWKTLDSVKLTEEEIKEGFDWAFQFAEEVKE